MLQPTLLLLLPCLVLPLSSLPPPSPGLAPPKVEVSPCQAEAQSAPCRVEGKVHQPLNFTVTVTSMEEVYWEPSIHYITPAANSSYARRTV